MSGGTGRGGPVRERMELAPGRGLARGRFPVPPINEPGISRRQLEEERRLRLLEVSLDDRADDLRLREMELRVRAEALAVKERAVAEKEKSLEERERNVNRAWIIVGILGILFYLK